MTGYLQQKGVDVQDSAKSSKDTLVAQVAASWYETEDKAQNAYFNIKDWILDTWTESQLKAFCDHHAIPGEHSILLRHRRNVPSTDRHAVPQPRQRDTILAKARSNYDTIAQKVGEAASYPGDWLYETWTGGLPPSPSPPYYARSGSLGRRSNYFRIRFERVA